MLALPTILLLTVLGIWLVLVLVLCIIDRSWTYNVLLFSFLGLDVGLILGLSLSPLIVALATGLLTLAGTLTTAWLQQRAAPAAAPPALDTRWLLPFAAALMAGLLAGIYLRVNDSLSLPHSLRDQFTEQGFTKEQVDAVMNRLATEGDLQKLKTESKASSYSTGLLSNEVRNSARTTVNDAMARQETPAEQLAYLKRQASDELKGLIAQAERFSDDPQAVLKTVQTLVNAQD